MNNTAIIAIVFSIYLLVMLIIGLLNYKKNDTLSDYILGGRKLGPWVTAMSAQASDMSGWLLLGVPGTAYVLYQGTTEVIWTAIGLFAGTYLNWLVTAKRLRKYTESAGDSVTLPAFFENRFRDKSGVLRIVSSIFILFFFLFYTASMFSASAKLFSNVFGINYQLALVVGVFIIVSYTFLGGFTAVCETDMIQGILMFIALLVVPIIGLSKLGGLGATRLQLSTLTTEVFSLIPKTDGAINTALLVSSMAWGLGYFGQPHILPRFMAIKNPGEIKPARIIATVWVFITLSCGVIVGIIGKALYPNLADGETIFMTMVQNMFSPIIAGVLLTAILAAVMSTADSQLLVASSAIAGDLYNGSINKNADGKTLVWVSRFAVLTVSILAASLVFIPNPEPGTILAKINASVFKLVSFAWAGFGAAFSPIILFSLFWRKTTKEGAIFGILAGGLSALLWWLKDGGIWDIYEILPGFIISSVVIVVVSLFTKNSQEILDEFDKVNKE